MLCYLAQMNIWPVFPQWISAATNAKRIQSKKLFASLSEEGWNNLHAVSNAIFHILLSEKREVASKACWLKASRRKKAWLSRSKFSPIDIFTMCFENWPKTTMSSDKIRGKGILWLNAMFRRNFQCIGCSMKQYHTLFTFLWINRSASECSYNKKISILQNSFKSAVNAPKCHIYEHRMYALSIISMLLKLLWHSHWNECRGSMMMILLYFLPLFPSLEAISTIRRNALPFYFKL